MPIYVLLVGCDETLRVTAGQLIGQMTHRVIALSDPQAALSVLSGIKFDVLVMGDLPAGTCIAGFLAAAKTLLPDLRVVGASHIARNQPAAEPLTLEALRRAFRIGDAPGYRYVRKSAEPRPMEPGFAAP